MNQAYITLIILAVVAVMFVVEIVPAAVVALSAVVLLVFFGILTPSDAFSGLSNSNVVLFGGMFVVGTAMLKSGLATAIGNAIVKKVGTYQIPLIGSFMALTVGMSAFASNTGTVACLLPVIIGVCLSARIPSAPILMATAVAANSGCMLTMVGTPPNMLAVAEAENYGLAPFGFFEFALLGGPIVIACTIFMLTIGMKLLPQREADTGLLTRDVGDRGTNRQRIMSLLILVFVVIGMIVGIPGLSPAMVALIAALLCVLTRTITEKQAYQGIDWQTIFLFAGMLPFALAMQKTGAGELIANTVIHALGSTPSYRMIIAALFIVSAGLTQFMPNTATAALLMPIGSSVCAKLGIPAYGALITVAVGTSCSFATPIATPCNTIVLGPSGMHFKDYVKVGVPLVLIAFVLTTVLVPMIW